MFFGIEDTQARGTSTLPARVGTGLILLSLAGFIWLGFPYFLSEYQFRFNPPPPEPTGDGFYISIPAIKIVSPIIANVDPFDKPTYEAALTQGIAHASGTSLPSQPGTVYLFAHSSSEVWRQLQTNPAFFRLGSLKNDDVIRIRYQGNDYVYSVTKTVTVKPSEVEHLLSTEDDQLILQTCTPIGTDWNRLLVFAKRINE